MCSENFSVTESNGFDGTGGAIFTVERIEMRVAGCSIVDVDFVRRSSVEKIIVDREAGQRKG